MTEVQAYFRIPIQDWLILDNCLMWIIHSIEAKSRLGKEQLNSKDEYYKNWLESVMQNIRDQAQNSTDDVDEELLFKELDKAAELTEDFRKVLEGSQLAVWKVIASEAK